MFKTIRLDARAGWRGLRKGGVSTLATIGTLALGIAAVGVIFSMLNGVLLRPLDYAEPGRLVVAGGYQNGEMVNISPPTYRDWETSARSFSELAAFAVRNVSVSGEGNPERLVAAFVTVDYFRVLGREAAVGRTFVDSEGVPGTDGVVLLSHSLWRARFAADPSVVGRKLRVNGETLTVVGAMPESFVSLLDAELWLPMAWRDEELGEAARTERYLSTVARLAPGVSRHQAQQELEALAGRIAAGNPLIDPTWSARVISLEDAVVGDFRPVLYTLFAAAGLVLLLVCANVTNLMTARYLERQGELALRSALGADRRSLLRQLVVEACMLSVTGGAVGLFLAWVGIRLLVTRGPQDIPRLDQLGVDGAVFAFVLLVSLLCGLIVGLLPAHQVSRFSLQEVLKEGGVRSSAGRSRAALRNLLVACQVALALALLIGAGLLITSFRNLTDVDPGFETDGVAVMRVVKSSSTSMGEASSFSRQVLDRLQALPGVRHAAVATNVPLISSRLTMEVLVEGQRPDGRLPESNYEVVSPEYFSALDVDLVAGRGFTDADRSGAPRVAIVNQALAERLQLDGEAVGSRLSFEGPSGPWWTVVGVAEDVHRFGLSEDPPPQVLVPWWQEPWFFMTFVVRTQGAPEPLFASLRRAVWEVDDDQAIAMLTTMDEMLSESMAQREFNAFLITVFGIAALLLTAVGLYGVMSYLATQRHHEIAIRLALGADRRAILGLMLRRGMLLLLSGVAAGLVIALLLARFIERLLFGITATDATTFAVVTAVVAVVAFTASFVPAYRSTRTDAALVLRQ